SSLRGCGFALYARRRAKDQNGSPPSRAETMPDRCSSAVAVSGLLKRRLRDGCWNNRQTSEFLRAQLCSTCDALSIGYVIQKLAMRPVFHAGRVRLRDPAALVPEGLSNLSGRIHP